jgi:anti-sigma-K factor RskA
LVRVMSDSYAPEALQDLMTRYVLGEFDHEERTAFEQFLAGNPAAAAEVRSLRRTLTLMPYGVTAEPPPHLRSRILRAAHVTRNRRVTRTLSRVPLGRIVGTIAALLAIGLGLDSYHLRQELALQKEVTNLIQQPNVLLSFSLEGTNPLSGAFGNVLLDLDAKRAAMGIRGLPPLPANQVYRLWALLREGEKVPCGQFNVNPQGTVLSLFSIPVDAYTSPIKQLIVTAEPPLALPQPVGPIVMISS